MDESRTDDSIVLAVLTTMDESRTDDSIVLAVLATMDEFRTDDSIVLAVQVTGQACNPSCCFDFIFSVEISLTGNLSLRWYT